MDQQGYESNVIYIQDSDNESTDETVIYSGEDLKDLEELLRENCAPYRPVFGPSPEEWVNTFLYAQKSARTYVQDDKVRLTSDVLLEGSTSWIKSLNQISEEPGVIWRN